MSDITILIEEALDVRVVEVGLPLIQGPSATRVSLTALADVAAGKLVNISNSAGAAKLSLADSTDDTKPADGFCPLAILSGNSGVVIVGRGQIVDGFVGLVPGNEYYLGTNGNVTDVCPAAAGNLVQHVGKALSATSMLLTLERGVTL